MGLDMYMMRRKRVTGVTPQDIDNYIEYREWRDYLKNNPTEKYSLWEFSRVHLSDVNRIKEEPRRILRKLYEKHEFTSEDVGYWRKANAIHGWIVDNIQDGEDDCKACECSEEALRELLEICIKVKESSKLVKGQILAGTIWDSRTGKEIPEYEDGLVIEDPSVAQELLPTCDGFFFGGTEYDEYYLENINDTIDILTDILETTDFDKEVIVYQSSW